MPRALPALAILLAVPLLAAAQEPTETVIRMTVDPAAAPRPALKYLLLPELAEMNPGNPILGYLKCFMEQHNFFRSKKAIEDRERWSEMPLKDLPVAELRGYGSIALTQADYAARLDTPDWQVLLKLKKEGMFLLLPEVQQLRELAGALKVRFRGEVAGRRFNGALKTAKTMFALSRHLGEHPTLISDLVGMAIAQITLDPLEEMMQQPGCPNLYWALTDLPRPFISLRKGLQGERIIFGKEIAVVDYREPMTEAQLGKALEQFRFVAAMAAEGKGDGLKRLGERFFGRVKDEAHVRAARRRLVETGLDAAKVKQFPAMQVVLLDEIQALAVLRDEVMKTMALPYWQAEGVLARRRPTKAGDDEPLGAVLLPAFMKVRRAQVRLDRHIALLRCVEALRLYAAAHQGRLPAKLADVGVPLPVDPFTGKSFVYQFDKTGATAVLRGTPPQGMERSREFNVRYEVTIRQQ
jgi:hypothetical protein